MKKLMVLISALVLLTSCEQLAQGIATVKKSEGTNTTKQSEKPKQGGEAGSASSASTGTSGSTSGGGGVASANTQSGEMVTITFDTDGENTPAPIKVNKGAQFIDLPQPTRENREFMGWTKRKNALTDFGSGMPLDEAQEDMTLYANWRIIDTSIGGASKNFRNKTVFVKGVPVPEEHEWKPLRGSDKKNIDWKPGHKWYDTDQFQYDLCWAAAASNIVQWWLDQNAKYIERYGDYKEKHEHRDRFNSDLFNFYRNNFSNQGNRTDVGFLWYIKGSFRDGAGFFKDVFENVDLKDNVDFINKREFNEMIDDALSNGKAISIVWAGHETTLWGADFDNEGYINKVYYTDSADDSKTEGLGLRYIDVVYQKEGDVLKPFVPSSVPGSYIKIAAISTFSLGQDVWEEYLRKHNK